MLPNDSYADRPEDRQRVRSITAVESVFVGTCSCSFGILDHVFTDTSTTMRLAGEIVRLVSDFELQIRIFI
jgi:hypothetical protein